MRNRRVFRYIWNFNAVMLAMGGCVGILLLLFVAYQAVTSYRPRHEPPPLAADADPDRPEQRLEIGSLTSLDGAGRVYLLLYVRDENSGSYSSKRGRREVHNILFANLEDQSSRWLFPANEQRILDHRGLTGQGSARRDEEALAMFYRVAMEDTNEDGEIDELDRQSVALSDLDGQRYTEIVSGLEELSGYETLNDREFALVYQAQAKLHIARVSLETFEVLSTVEVPPVAPR